MPAQFANIYQALCENCPRVEIAPPWDFVQPRSDCLRITDLDERFAAIRAQFSDANTLSAGLAVRGDNGAITTNPKLLFDDGQIVVLRNTNGVIYDVLTGGGCLSGAVPALTMHKDHQVADGLCKSEMRVVLGTFTLGDTILLRSMGVAAAPATNLDQLSVPWLQRLLTLVESSSRGGIAREYSRLRSDDPEDSDSDDLGPDEEEPGVFSLVLLAGSIQSLNRELPVGLTAVARHLADAARHLDISWHGLHVWWPSPEELENLVYRRRLRSPALLQEFFGAQRNLRPVADFVTGRPPQASGLAERWADLLRQIQDLQKKRDLGQWYQEELTRVVAQYDALVEQHMVLPLAEAAFAQVDPRRRCIELQIAHINRMVQRMMLSLHVSLAACVDKRLDTDREFLPVVPLKQMESLLNCSIRLFKELSRD